VSIYSNIQNKSRDVHASIWCRDVRRCIFDGPGPILLTTFRLLKTCIACYTVSTRDKINIAVHCPYLSADGL